MTKGQVKDRLASAEKRLNDLLALNRGNLPGANASERQQLVQEFFFHLIGTIDVLAQVVNDVKALGLDSEDVSVPAVIKRLGSTDPAVTPLAAVHVKTRGMSVPGDPYSDDALLFRAYNYRHQVTHRGTNPFLFRVGSLPPTSFHLDPRNTGLGHSTKAAQDEMRQMLQLISMRCDAVLALI